MPIFTTKNPVRLGDDGRRRRPMASPSQPKERFDPYATVYGNQRSGTFVNATRGELVPPDHTITGIPEPYAPSAPTIIRMKRNVPANLSAQQFPDGEPE